MFEDYNSFNTPAPALSNYIIYTEQGVRPDYSSYLKGIWISGNVRSFSDAKYDPTSDVRFSDSAVNYNTPGVYTVTFQLSQADKNGTNRTDQGSATMIVVVEG